MDNCFCGERETVSVVASTVSIMKKITLALALSTTIALLATGCVFTPSGVPEDTTETTIAVATPTETEAVEEANVVEEADETEAVEEAEADSDLTLAQQNAIGRAESYLSFTAFSREGLIEQLEYEGYSNADATFAVDAINVDWNEQAALQAEQYLELMSFSRQGLIDQLLYEGFTQEQAEYGASAVGY